jgi:hypothetical protein
MKDRARLAAIVVVLAAAAGAAYDLSSGDATDPTRPLSQRPPPPAAPASRADTVGHWKADILARPLIYPGRRAPSPGVVAEHQAVPEPVPRLTGVIVGLNRRSALFVTGQGARPTVVQEGAHIGPYVVRSIRSNEVVVEGPDGTRSLHPTYDGAPQPSGPAPALPKRAAMEHKADAPSLSVLL